MTTDNGLDSDLDHDGLERYLTGVKPVSMDSQLRAETLLNIERALPNAIAMTWLEWADSRCLRIAAVFFMCCGLMSYLLVHRTQTRMARLITPEAKSTSQDQSLAYGFAAKTRWSFGRWSFASQKEPDRLLQDLESVAEINSDLGNYLKSIHKDKKHVEDPPADRRLRDGVDIRRGDLLCVELLQQWC